MTGNTVGGPRHADRPGAMADAEVTIPGRHRIHADGTWTPVVPPRAAGHHRHRTEGGAAAGTPVERGSETSETPVQRGPHTPRQPVIASPPLRANGAPRRVGQPVYPDSSGTLPVAAPPYGPDHGGPVRGDEPATSSSYASGTLPVGAPGTSDQETVAPRANGMLPQPSGRRSSPGESASPRVSGTLPVGGPGQRAENRNRAAFAPPQDQIPDEHRAFAPPGSALPQPTRRSRQERVATTAAALAAAPETEKPQGGRERVELNPAAGDPLRRQRVTLRTAPVAAPEPESQDDEVRVYSAPLLDGLGTFDLGSVPASVTPPKTWRKAAWFATGASGAVVVGLLFAGTFLVGGPATTTTDAIGGWPGRQNGGGPDLSALLPNGQHGGAGGNVPRNGTSTRTDGTPSDNGTQPQQGNESSSAASNSSTGQTTPAGPDSTSASAPATTSSPTSSEPPEKPPVTPAQRETVQPTYFTTSNANTMGNNSEKFFNNVTTDPATASSVTSGDLKEEGPQGLRKRYSGVAYYEVKKVTIDPEHNTTVNTVEVTNRDGSKTTEQRTLTFDDNGKITDDGR
ncbi:hypothetical protein [Amycolatopsis benzoatilytica]|uniref:hypothetical protein n=1 Tax=Amycolatopsis benzoatilytica TaxID=346045 RepID=UPI001B7FB42C|nr:hypothetical protein [Amycolatopsis benzoatilytica]